MNNEQVCNSPDEFMFSEFQIHASIFHKKNKYDYFMISSGTNQFPLTKMWKQSLHHEIESDYLYRWYTSAEGFQTATRTIKIYEDYLASKGNFFPKDINNDVCLTIGGSGAASLVFDYLKKKYLECDVILVGMNYSLYERLSKKNAFNIFELSSKNSCFELPHLSDFKDQKWSARKKIFIFSNPNNPTGSVYQLSEFKKIVAYISSINGYIIWDKVCDLVISHHDYLYFEHVITQYSSWNNSVIINSFSKTDATAGFRIGYIYGNKELIKTVAEIQANSIMNPPTFPVFSIVLTCMFRCMYLNRTNNIKHYKETLIRNLFRHLFYYTGAIISSEMRQFAAQVFNNYLKYYASYVNELLDNEKIIFSNYLLTLEILKPYIFHFSELQGGFNFCVCFNKKFHLTEFELVQQLIDNTGVAVLTESSFTTLRRRKSNYFIRFSTACNPLEYKQALYRMKHFFDEGVIFDD